MTHLITTPSLRQNAGRAAASSNTAPKSGERTAPASVVPIDSYVRGRRGTNGPLVVVAQRQPPTIGLCRLT